MTNASLCVLHCAKRGQKTQPCPGMPTALLYQRRVPGTGSRAEEAVCGGEKKLHRRDDT